MVCSTSKQSDGWQPIRFTPIVEETYAVNVVTEEPKKLNFDEEFLKNQHCCVYTRVSNCITCTKNVCWFFLDCLTSSDTD